MQKKLSIVGNSLALVIDKPLRRMLGLGPDARVRLTIEGRRLIVEPIGSATTETPSAPRTARADALRVFMALVEKHGMAQAQFRQLHPAGIRMGAYRGSLLTNLTLHGEAVELVARQRLTECLRALSAGASWDDAIAAALVAVPAAA